MINNEATTKFYTDGINTIKVKPGEEIPDGYHLGRTFNARAWNKGLTAKTDDRVKQGGEKTKQTRMANGSYDNPWNKGQTKETNSSLQTVSDKVSAARKDKFWASTTGPKSDEQKAKQSAAMLGTEPWNKGLTKETDERVKQTSDKLIGHKCFVTDWPAAKQKEYITKKLNHSFNTSQPEIQYLKELEDMYGAGNVLTQYTDPRYVNPKNGVPFKCDFYVKSEDLFIELNYYWSHGSHPFDENNKEDLERLADLQLQLTMFPNKRSYSNAIYVWTESDPIKLNEMRKNKLNFLVLYPNGLVVDK